MKTKLKHFSLAKTTRKCVKKSLLFDPDSNLFLKIETVPIIKIQQKNLWGFQNILTDQNR